MNKLAIIGGTVILVMALLSVFAPFFAKYDPTEINIRNSYLAPSTEHLFGTDSLGRDIYSRIPFGGRVALSIGLVAVGISTLIGLLLGAIAGYYDNKISYLIMRFTDIMLCFPTLFLMLSVVAMIGPGIFNIMIIIGLTSWMGVARLIRAEILTLKKRDYVLAAKSLGRSDLYIIGRHLIPNGIGPVLVSFVFGVAQAILIEAGLSFIGLGVQPPTPSWGNILIEGKSALGVAWWLVFFPGASIFVTVLSFNLLGEGLREMVNPRLLK